MKKLMFVLLSVIGSLNLFAVDYYLSSSTGNDNNDGQSSQKPFKSLEKIEKLPLSPGDKILLKKGDTFYGCINLKDVAGEKEKPIQVAAYGGGDQKPIVDAKGLLNGILIENCSYLNVFDIEITANGGGIENFDSSQNYLRCGVLITTSKNGEYSGITLENLFVRDVFFEEPGFSRTTAETLTGNGTQNYGWGIRVINSNTKAILKDILITDCHVKNVSHSGIRFTGNHGLSTDNFKNIRNVKVHNNIVEYTGGPAMQASVVENVEFVGNQVDHSGSGDDSRKWARGSGLWVWGCLNALIEHNSFRNANGPGDSAGCHIDFNNKNVIIQYNLSENNAGGFIHILGNNQNCTYRYNVSINDGSREHVPGENLGQGNMIDVNGFVGFNKKEIGPFNTYLYNNTIYVKEGLHPEAGIAKSNSGILIANNIFYLESSATYRDKDNFFPSSGPVPNVIFKNNLFLKADNWPDASKVMITDEAPVYGDPQFVNGGGLEIKDYVPQNIELIKDKGVEIEMIPGDAIGIVGGLKVEKDILGNEIKGMPDLGAIEME